MEVKTKMGQNDVRDSLSSRIDVAELEYDISRLTSELNYHKSKTVIFEQTVKAQQKELDELLGNKSQRPVRGEFYK